MCKKIKFSLNAYVLDTPVSSQEMWSLFSLLLEVYVADGLSSTCIHEILSGLHRIIE